MTDKMTLDDLCEGLKVLNIYPRDLKRVTDFIETRRAEIEAGMKPALRFECQFNEAGVRQWMLLKDDGRWMLDSLEPQGYYMTFVNKKVAEEFAASLGLRAEFVEEGS